MSSRPAQAKVSELRAMVVSQVHGSLLRENVPCQRTQALLVPFLKKLVLLFSLKVSVPMA
jgi:hypothetical protein